jgi:hypothetical protein
MDVAREGEEKDKLDERSLLQMFTEHLLLNWRCGRFVGIYLILIPQICCMVRFFLFCIRVYGIASKRGSIDGWASGIF